MRVRKCCLVLTRLATRKNRFILARKVVASLVRRLCSKEKSKEKDVMLKGKEERMKRRSRSGSPPWETTWCFAASLARFSFASLSLLVRFCLWVPSDLLLLLVGSRYLFANVVPYHIKRRSVSARAHTHARLVLSIIHTHSECVDRAKKKLSRFGTTNSRRRLLRLHPFSSLQFTGIARSSFNIFLYVPRVTLAIVRKHVAISSVFFSLLFYTIRGEQSDTRLVIREWKETP